MTATDTTRRRARRLHWEVPISVYDGRRSVRARLHNISEGGAFVSIEPPLPLDTGVSFWLVGPEAKILIRGHVRWTRSLEGTAGEPVGCGVEFYDPDGTTRAEVLALIEALSLG
jgi:hypothetical protein